MTAPNRRRAGAASSLLLSLIASLLAMGEKRETPPAQAESEKVEELRGQLETKQQQIERLEDRIGQMESEDAQQKAEREAARAKTAKEEAREAKKEAKQANQEPSRWGRWTLWFLLLLLQGGAMGATTWGRFPTGTWAGAGRLSALGGSTPLAATIYSFFGTAPVWGWFLGPVTGLGVFGVYQWWTAPAAPTTPAPHPPAPAPAPASAPHGGGHP